MTSSKKVKLYNNNHEHIKYSKHFFLNFQFDLPSNVTVKQEPEDPVPNLPVLPVVPGTPNTPQPVKVEVETDAEPPIKKSALEDIFGDIFVVNVQPAKPVNQRCSDEIDKFKTAPCLPMDQNPLDWWKAHCYEYPFLSKVAKVYLGIPATSVPSERVFSCAGDIVTAQRSMLNPDNVDKLIFLKKNMN